jgi:hypothetical protein
MTTITRAPLFGKLAITVGCVALATVGVLFAALLWRSAPFDLASYAVWAGIFLAVAAVGSLARPPGWLGRKPRSRAAFLLVLGGSMTVTALMWPSHMHRSARAHCRLDDFLPEFQFVEYHEARTRAPLERVLEAARHVSLADMPAARVLIRLRGLASGKLSALPPDTTPLIDLFARSGQGSLMLDASSPREIVLGTVGRPWKDEPPPQVTLPADFLTFSLPGHVRVVFDIRTADEGSGFVRVSTETRILGNDAEARRVFARYWRLIYPGSAIIRRVWLDAIVARAERGQS